MSAGERLAASLFLIYAVQAGAVTDTSSADAGSKAIHLWAVVEPNNLKYERQVVGWLEQAAEYLAKAKIALTYSTLHANGVTDHGDENADAAGSRRISITGNLLDEPDSAALEDFVAAHPRDIFLWAMPNLTLTLDRNTIRGGSPSGTRFIFLGPQATSYTVSHELWHVLADYGRDYSGMWDKFREIYFLWQWETGPSDAFGKQLRKGVDHWSRQ